MDVSNDTKTPGDTRVSSAGGSGFHQYPPKPELSEAASAAWRTIQPGETASFDLRGAGPWKVEIRFMKDGRWKPKSATVRTPYDKVTLIENGDDVELRVSHRAAS
ncbi:MAG: hypothetical protein ACLGI9_17490 [Thermoanaerobaculia bacterium]